MPSWTCLGVANFSAPIRYVGNSGVPFRHWSAHFRNKRTVSAVRDSFRANTHIVSIMSTCNLEPGNYTITTDTDYPVVLNGSSVIVDGSQTVTPQVGPVIFRWICDKVSPYRQVFNFNQLGSGPCTYTMTPNGAEDYVDFTNPDWKIVLGTLNQNWVITLVEGSNNVYTWAPLACTVTLFLTWPSLSIQPSGSSEGWTNPGACNQVKVVQTIPSAIIHTLFQIYLNASYTNWKITKK